jgi:ribosomal protein L35AE/L33A
MITKTEMERLATILGKADTSQMNEIISLVRNAQTQAQAKAASSFNIGDAVMFKSKGGQVVRGTIAKVNRKTIAVKSGQMNWRVSPSLLRFQF